MRYFVIIMSNKDFITIIRYDDRYKNQWDSFVTNAKNGSFLFYRDFMEYHKDRFIDFSLMFFYKDVLKAVLPANKVNDVFYSHQGLTYGGLVVAQQFNNDLFRMTHDVLQHFLRDNGFHNYILKQKQFIYNKQVFEWEQLYFKDVLHSTFNLVADLSNLKVSKSKLKHYRKNDKMGFIVREESCLSNFWTQVLEPLLLEKYQTKPLHNLEEIQNLKNRFPTNIQQFSLYQNEKIIAGITIFRNGKVVKSQYGAATAYGKAVRAMDYLFIYLLFYFKELQFLFFDMGTVADDQFEQGINKGLLQQKIELGCTIMSQVTFKLNM